MSFRSRAATCVGSAAAFSSYSGSSGTNRDYGNATDLDKMITMMTTRKICLMRGTMTTVSECQSRVIIVPVQSRFQPSNTLTGVSKIEFYLNRTGTD